MRAWGSCSSGGSGSRWRALVILSMPFCVSCLGAVWHENHYAGRYGGTYLLNALNAFGLNVPPKARILVELHESLGDGSLQTRNSNNRPHVYQARCCSPTRPCLTVTAVWKKVEVLDSCSSACRHRTRDILCVCLRVCVYVCKL